MSPRLAPSSIAGLARRIDALVADFPATAAEVSVPDLLDDIGMLTHYLQYVAERMQERFAEPDDVGLAERAVLCEMAGAAEKIAQAQERLTSALAHATAGSLKELMFHSHPHLLNDPELARTIAAEKYGEAGICLRAAARQLGTTAVAGPRSTPAPPCVRPSRATSSVPVRR